MKIVLLTRMVTSNYGNQALSQSIARTILQAVPDAALCSLERVHPHLTQFEIFGAGDDSADVVDAFEHDVRTLCTDIKRCSNDEVAVFHRDPERFLPKFNSQPRSFIRRALQPTIAALGVRKALAKRGRYRSGFMSRTGAMAEADWVIVNPGGEFNPTSIDVPLRMLLQLRVAQELGAKVGIVNFSLEVESEPLIAVIRHVFPKLDMVLSRDSETFSVLKGWGLDDSVARTVPDAVFRAGVAGGSDFAIADKTDSVAIAINPPSAGDPRQWIRVCRDLVERGKKVSYFMGEPLLDREFAKRICLASGAELVDEPLDYIEAMALLARQGVLISNRLHPMVFAIQQGVPVVPIESFKLKNTGLFRDLGYPLPVLSPQSPNWSDVALAQYQDLVENYNERCGWLHQRIGEVRESILDAYGECLDEDRNAE